MACEAIAKQSLNLQAFVSAADAHVKLLPRPAAASEWLICLRSGGPELPETLMLHRGRLAASSLSPEAVEDAFLHYVINTANPRLDWRESANLERLAARYIQSLFLPSVLAAGAAASCETLA